MEGRINLDQSALPGSLHVGTSSFSSADWYGVFYPGEISPSEFLQHYSRTFPTVEIDATWHFMPNPKTVDAWAKKVPEGFVFAAKVPKVITHEKLLKGCEDDWKYFVDTMGRLGPKLGPLLFQFQYVAKRTNAREYETGEEFRRRLEAFLPLLPPEHRYAVEVRNPKWLGPELTDLLRSRNISLTLIDQCRMPRPARWFDMCDPITADFTYVRFLGDHHAMDELVAHKREAGEKTGDWNELVVDRAAEMREWVPLLDRLTGRVGDVYAYFNNHYAGFAPGSIELFLKTWKEMAPPA
jgi:uncharacterized protein YecE (DUF72 family)